MPPIKINKLTAIVGALFVIEAIGYHRLKQDFELVTSAFNAVHTENEDLTEKCKYLCHLIDESDIEVSEFDLIVLTQDLSTEK